MVSGGSFSVLGSSAVAGGSSFLESGVYLHEEVSI